MSVRPYNPKQAKKGETWWMIDVGRGKDRRRIPHQGDYDEAKDIELHMRGGAEKVITPSSKIKDFVVDYLRQYATEASPRTVRDIRFSINLYIVPKFCNLSPAQLTVQLFNTLRSSYSLLA